MIDVFLLVGLILLFGCIIHRLIKHTKEGCPPSCAGCPVVKTCKKESVYTDLREFLDK